MLQMNKLRLQTPNDSPSHMEHLVARTEQLHGQGTVFLDCKLRLPHLCLNFSEPQSSDRGNWVNNLHLMELGKEGHGAVT